MMTEPSMMTKRENRVLLLLPLRLRLLRLLLLLPLRLPLLLRLPTVEFVWNSQIVDLFD